ncbi:MAG: exo-alpha-sialidase [Nitrospinae bacterium]|nr:exo-alpha-sialidase [Nitrospinota bacterium]
MGAIRAAILLLALSAGMSWGEPAFTTSLVFPPKSFGRPHGASLVELKNGDIMASWFSAKEETHADAEIYGAVLNKKTGVWGAPFTIIPKGYSKSVGNTALFRDDDGLIWMFFASVRIGGWSGAMVDYVTSADEGKTWTSGATFTAWPGNLPRNIPIKTGDHQMLIPLFVDFWYEANLVGAYTALVDYRDGAVVSKKYASLEDTDAIQPTLVKLPDGKILMLARDKSDRFIRRAYSSDGGLTWGPSTMTTLPNPGAGICAIYVEELKAVLLAYNHSRKGRNPLSLAVSTDNGRRFRKITDLESKPGDTEASFDYPAMIRAADGTIHLIWTHDNRATLKHARFNVEWLRSRISGAR